MSLQSLWGGRAVERMAVLFFIFIILSDLAQAEQEEFSDLSPSSSLPSSSSSSSSPSSPSSPSYSSSEIFDYDGEIDLAHELDFFNQQGDQYSLRILLGKPNTLSKLYPLYHALLREVGSRDTFYLEDNAYGQREGQIARYRGEVNQMKGRPNWGKIWAWLKGDPVIGVIFNPLLVLRIYRDQVRPYPGTTLPEKFWHFAWMQLNQRVKELRALELQHPRLGRQELYQEVLRIMAVSKRPLAMADLDQLVTLEDMICLPSSLNYRINDRRLAVLRGLAQRVGRFERPIHLSEGSWQDFNGRTATFTGEKWMIPLITPEVGQTLQQVIMQAHQQKKKNCAKLVQKQKAARLLPRRP